MKKYKFSLEKKLRFYLLFLPLKIKIFTEVKKGKLEILLAEIFWILNGIFKKRFSFPIYSGFYETNYGKFFIHKDIQSLITLSPTFERADRNLITKMIKRDLNKNEKVLFIDVGAHIGLYSIQLGKMFKKNRNFHIISFEPNANNFYGKNYELLNKNIKMNNLKHIIAYNIALGDRETSIPNKFGLKTIPLDSIINSGKAKEFDTIYFKIDIEGYEKSALVGARKFIRSANKVNLLIEDCVDKEIVQYLTKNFQFIDKLTPYNSFWSKPNPK